MSEDLGDSCSYDHTRSALASKQELKNILESVFIDACAVVYSATKAMINITYSRSMTGIDTLVDFNLRHKLEDLFAVIDLTEEERYVFITYFTDRISRSSKAFGSHIRDENFQEADYYKKYIILCSKRRDRMYGSEVEDALQRIACYKRKMLDLLPEPWHPAVPANRNSKFITKAVLRKPSIMSKRQSIIKNTKQDARESRRMYGLKKDKKTDASCLFTTTLRESVGIVPKKTGYPESSYSHSCTLLRNWRKIYCNELMSLGKEKTASFSKEDMRSEDLILWHGIFPFPIVVFDADSFDESEDYHTICSEIFGERYAKYFCSVYYRINSLECKLGSRVTKKIRWEDVDPVHGMLNSTDACGAYSRFFIDEYRLCTKNTTSVKSNSKVSTDDLEEVNEFGWYVNCEILMKYPTRYSIENPLWKSAMLPSSTAILNNIFSHPGKEETFVDSKPFEIKKKKKILEIETHLSCTDFVTPSVRRGGRTTKKEYTKIVEPLVLTTFNNLCGDDNIRTVLAKDAYCIVNDGGVVEVVDATTSTTVSVRDAFLTKKAVQIVKGRVDRAAKKDLENDKTIKNVIPYGVEVNGVRGNGSAVSSYGEIVRAQRAVVRKATTLSPVRKYFHSNMRLYIGQENVETFHQFASIKTDSEGMFCTVGELAEHNILPHNTIFKLAYIMEGEERISVRDKIQRIKNVVAEDRTTRTVYKEALEPYIKKAEEIIAPVNEDLLEKKKNVLTIGNPEYKKALSLYESYFDGERGELSHKELDRDIDHKMFHKNIIKEELIRDAEQYERCSIGNEVAKGHLQALIFTDDYGHDLSSLEYSDKLIKRVAKKEARVVTTHERYGLKMKEPTTIYPVVMSCDRGNWTTVELPTPLDSRIKYSSSKDKEELSILNDSLTGRRKYLKVEEISKLMARSNYVPFKEQEKKTTVDDSVRNFRRTLGEKKASNIIIEKRRLANLYSKEATQELSGYSKEYEGTDGKEIHEYSLSVDSDVRYTLTQIGTYGNIKVVVAGIKGLLNLSTMNVILTGIVNLSDQVVVLTGDVGVLANEIHTQNRYVTTLLNFTCEVLKKEDREQSTEEILEITSRTGYEKGTHNVLLGLNTESWTYIKCRALLGDMKKDSYKTYVEQAVRTCIPAILTVDDKNETLTAGVGFSQYWGGKDVTGKIRLLSNESEIKRLNLGKNILLLQEDEEITVQDNTNPETYNSEPLDVGPVNAFGLPISNQYTNSSVQPVKRRFNFANFIKPTIKKKRELL